MRNMKLLAGTSHPDLAGNVAAAAAAVPVRLNPPTIKKHSQDGPLAQHALDTRDRKQV